MLPYREAMAIAVIGSVVSSISFLAESSRCACATRYWRSAQMLQEQPAQVTRSHSKALGERVHPATFPGAFQCPLID